MNEVVIESLDTINERVAIESKLLEFDYDDQIEAYESLFEEEFEEETKEDSSYWEDLFCPEAEMELNF